MMFTASMTQLFAIVLDKDSGPVTEAILREGVMEFIRVCEFQSDRQKNQRQLSPEEEIAHALDLRKRIEGLLSSGSGTPVMPGDIDISNRISVNTEKEKARLDKIDLQCRKIRDRQRSIQQEVLRLEDIRRQIDIYGLSLSGAKFPQRQSLLSMQTGTIPIQRIRQLEDGFKGMPALNIELGVKDDISHQLLVTMRRDDEKVNKVISACGWSRVELPSELLSDKENLLEEISVKTKKLTGQQEKLQAQVKELIASNQKWLTDCWVNLRINELCSRIQANFESSSKTVVFAGWLPASKRQSLEKRITQACGDRCYMEWYEAESKDIISDKVPVVLHNPRIFQPFQLLVSNFGIPRYRTIDPTPFLMPIYLAMFGLMFPDVGQGVVLLILGTAGAILLRKKEGKKKLAQLSWLVAWCGVSAIFFGAAFGSYFGMSLIKPFWFNFHGIVSGHGSGSSMIRNISDVLLISLYFGILVIILGLSFNWINLVRTRNWSNILFDKGGIPGVWIYFGGLYIGYYMVSHDYRQFPPGGLMFLLSGLPSLLLLAGRYRHNCEKNRRSEHKANLLVFSANLLMEWLTELLEVFTTFLSNTLSFMRVAGLGIAHVCLMIAIFEMADMTEGFFSVLILLLGNIIVIAFEGLSAGIQALRLNYYEFFTKFFQATGRLHRPISLSSNF